MEDARGAHGGSQGRCLRGRARRVGGGAPHDLASIDEVLDRQKASMTNHDSNTFVTIKGRVRGARCHSRPPRRLYQHRSSKTKGKRGLPCMPVRYSQLRRLIHAVVQYYTGITYIHPFISTQKETAMADLSSHVRKAPPIGARLPDPSNTSSQAVAKAIVLRHDTVLCPMACILEDAGKRRTSARQVQQAKAKSPMPDTPSTHQRTRCPISCPSYGWARL